MQCSAHCRAIQLAERCVRGTHQHQAAAFHGRTDKAFVHCQLPWDIEHRGFLLEEVYALVGFGGEIPKVGTEGELAVESHAKKLDFVFLSYWHVVEVDGG